MSSSLTSETESAGYAAFLAAAAPVDIWLTHCEADGDRIRYATLDSKAQLTRHADAVYDVQGINSTGMLASARVNVRIRDAKTPEGEDGGDVFRVVAEFAIFFDLGGTEFPLEYAKRFANAEMRLVAWPFFRQAIADISHRMGLPVVMLPLALRKPSDRTPATVTSKRTRKATRSK